MKTKTVARCSIYDRRPEICRVYPTVGHYIPPQCTYFFAGGERRGECACDEGACCATPRQNGEPGGTAMPDIVGGAPCKYLVWDEIVVKEASEDIGIADGCSFWTDSLSGEVPK